MHLARSVAYVAVLTLAACGAQTTTEAPSPVSDTQAVPSRPTAVVPSMVRMSLTPPPIVSASPVPGASKTPETDDEAAALAKSLERLALPLPETDISGQTSAIEAISLPQR